MNNNCQELISQWLCSSRQQVDPPLLAQVLLCNSPCCETNLSTGRPPLTHPTQQYRYHKRSCSITTSDRLDRISMAWKRSLQMCVYPKIPCIIQFPKLTIINVVSFFLPCQVSIYWHKWQFTDPRDYSPARVGHMIVYIEWRPIVDPVCYLVDMLIKFIYNHLGDNNNHAPAMGRFVDMIYALVSMTEPIRGHHAVQLCEV